MTLQAFESLALSFVECLRDVDHDVDQFVACCTTLRRWQTFTTESEHLAGLSARCDFQTCATGDGRNFNRTAKCSSGEVEHEVVDNVVTVTDEFRVLDFIDNHEEVTGDSIGTRSARVVTFATHREHIAVGHTGGDFERYEVFLSFHTFAMTERAWGRNDFTFAVASGADFLRHHLSEHGVRNLLNHPRSVTCGTGAEGRTILGSGAVAVTAFFVNRNFESFRYTRSDFSECHFDFYSEVATFFGLTSTGTSTGSSTPLTAETSAEDIAELAENIFH